MAEALREDGQRGLDIDELVGDHVLAASGGDLEGVALGRDGEEVDVGEAGSDGAGLGGGQDLLGVAAGEDLERCEGLFGNVHALDYLKRIGRSGEK